jgi:AcrR family transcriptional regulator
VDPVLGRAVEVAENLTSEAPPGRRQEHKSRTQQALQQAALELFAKHGFDTTTTDEIAEQAGVSPRTFFRYFPTKESILFVGEHGWIQSLTTQFLDQPASLTDLEALRETLLDFASKQAAGRRSLVLYERAVASSPTLRGRVQERVQADSATVATAVAERRGQPAADEGCALLAAVVLMTYRRALTRWLQGPANGNLRRVVADEFALLVAQVAPSTAPSA